MNISEEEKKKWILENCVDAFGDIDLKYLDFSDFGGSVDISHMKVKGNLYQGLQEVNGDLYQGCQKVQGDLFQYEQKVSGDLCQGCQKVQGDLFQDEQTVQGDLFQGEQTVQGGLFQDETNNYERGVADTERKYFGDWKMGDVCYYVSWFAPFVVRKGAIVERWLREDKHGAIIHFSIDSVNIIRKKVIDCIFKTEEEAQEYLAEMERVENE